MQVLSENSQSLQWALLYILLSAKIRNSKLTKYLISYHPRLQPAVLRIFLSGNTPSAKQAKNAPRNVCKARRERCKHFATLQSFLEALGVILEAPRVFLKPLNEKFSAEILR
jgi:histidyl-tRNA synthetase